MGLALLLLFGLFWPHNFIMLAAWAEDSARDAQSTAFTEAETTIPGTEAASEAEEQPSTDATEADPAGTESTEAPEEQSAAEGVQPQTVTLTAEGFSMEIRGLLPAEGQITVEPAETPEGITTRDSVSYCVSAANGNPPLAPMEVTVRDPRIRELCRDCLQILVIRPTDDGGLEPIKPLYVKDDTICFQTDRLSSFTVGGYAEDTLLTWSTQDYELSLLGIEGVNAACTDASAASEPGVDVLGAWTLSVSGPLSKVSAYHVIVRARTEPQLQGRETVDFCQVRSGAVKNVLAQGIEHQSCIPLENADGVFALVQDSGLREQSLETEAVKLTGLMPKNAALSVTDVRDKSPETAEGIVLAAYDITILDQGEVFQPASGHPIEVSIALNEAAVGTKNLQLWHVRDDGGRERISDFALLDGRICFSASGFSVYEIVEAPDPYIPPEAVESVIVADMTEFSANFDDANGFLLSVYRAADGKIHYFKNTLNGNHAFTPETNIYNASRWFFKYVSGQYKIYSKIGGVDHYMKQAAAGSNNMALTANENDASTFLVSAVDGLNGKFYFQLVNPNTNTGSGKFLQYSNGGNGFRLYNGLGTNNLAEITVTYASSVFISDDYYELDGKTFSIAYREQSVMAAGLSTTPKTVNNRSCLDSLELLVRPDVLGSNGELLVAQDTDLPNWTFTCEEGSQYRVTTHIGGELYYLTLNGANLTLSTEKNSNNLLSVVSGTESHKGCFMFSVGNYALTLTGDTSGNNWFSSSNNGGDKSWLNLVEKSALLDTEDFVVYSAAKVDLSDRAAVPDGAQVVIYTRLWNDADKRYEFYAVNFNGRLVRAYESGDMIQWVGSAVNTLVWDFTEYQYDNGAPNFYYELQNTYSGKYIAPQLEDQILSDETIGINLNGRRYGYFYTTILAWDTPHYSYVGLCATSDRSRIEPCPMNQAENFYFAIMKPTPVDGEHSTVDTIDHKQYGITMKVQNFATRAEMSNLLGTDAYVQYTPQQGLLSSRLGEDGYPLIATGAHSGSSLNALFSHPQEVNNLFIENTYFSSGYYEYDSTQNYASLRKENGEMNTDTENADITNFIVYTQLGTSDSKSSDTMKHGLFLPFNALSDVKSEKNPYNLYDALGNELPDSNPRKGEDLLLAAGETDYYFGVELEASFTQTVSGQDAWGHDIIYEFTGDDDFWLYVDGELIIDLGGIHSALPGSVNYCTGEVVVNGVTTNLRAIFKNNYKGRNPNASEEELAAYLDEYFAPGENIFKDYSNHTMKIFYMERGAGASNLHMRFNLASVKPGTVELSKEIAGVDSPESFMAEYPFQIFYKKNEENAVEEQLIPGVGTISVKYKDTNRDVSYHSIFTCVDGNTHYNHVFMLQPGETAVISFPDDTFEYRIQECYLDTTIYEEVTVNGDELQGTDVYDANGAPVTGRQDYSSEYNSVLEQSRITFTNHVYALATGILTITKRLYDEYGTTQITHENSNNAIFTFRLYLGTENDIDDELPLANMHTYQVRDENGNYCKWVTGQGFVSLGKSDFSQLTSTERSLATFRTSMNGMTDKIPVDYTIEVRGIPAGTKYRVEERLREIPDGYSLQKYLLNGEPTDNNGKTPAEQVISLAGSNNVEVCNIKGWGIRARKVWSDEDYMAYRGPAYFALYLPDGSMASDSVKQLKFGEESVYWFIEHLAPGAVDLSGYHIREVTLTGGNITTDPNTGVVSGFTAVTPIPVGGTVTLSGRQYGDSSSSSFTYTVVRYDKGDLTGDSNVRLDTLTNRRAGVELYKMAWDGTTPLAGAKFTLTDGQGRNAGSVESFNSDTNGLITIAYLRENETYTLREVQAPAGFRGLQSALELQRVGSTVTVTAVDSGETSYYSLDDTDVAAGENLRCGLLTVKNKPCSLTIQKTDETKRHPLEDVRFALYAQVTDNNGNPRRDYRPLPGFEELDTNESGIVPQISAAFQNGTLKPGTYYLNEIAPLSGYQPLAGDLIFTYGETGVISVDNSVLTDVELTTVDGSSAISNTILVPNKVEGTATLTVNKTVLNGTTADYSGEHPFNFVVRLYLPDGRTEWHFDNNDFIDGIATFSLGHGHHNLTVPLGAVVTVSEEPRVGYDANGWRLDPEDPLSEDVCRVTVTEAMAVEFVNTRKLITVTVKKSVEGEGGSFDFTATLTDGTTRCESWPLYSNGTVSTVTDSSGQAIFTLSPASNKTVSRNLTIPYGTSLTVTEAHYDDYVTKVGNSVTNTWTKSNITANQTITFTNIRSSSVVAPTGLPLHSRPFGWVLACGVFLCASLLLLQRRGSSGESDPPGAGGSGRGPRTDPHQVRKRRRKRNGPTGEPPRKGPPRRTAPAKAAALAPLPQSVFNETLNIQNYI
jgi:fibro-slime domain-containing protein